MNKLLYILILLATGLLVGCGEAYNKTITNSYELPSELSHFDLLPRLKPWDSNAYCTAGAST